MKKILQGLVIILLVIGCARTISDLVLKVGNGTDNDVTIEAELGKGASNPSLKYNSTDNKWQACDEGGTCKDIVGGSMHLQTIEIKARGTDGNISDTRNISVTAGARIRVRLSTSLEGRTVSATLGGGSASARWCSAGANGGSNSSKETYSCIQIPISASSSTECALYRYGNSGGGKVYINNEAVIEPSLDFFGKDNNSFGNDYCFAAFSSPCNGEVELVDTDLNGSISLITDVYLSYNALGTTIGTSYYDSRIWCYMHISELL